ncbi:uncharacterized protein AMSG_07944 [Thecamonas trahens ATCC 50062]|uniref:Uncharacterized protein n=1 Tax=Thecamonas trahens ATCC 50062 TaxID=461836 RepID=A0A0L0DHR3_THETB|nr:hypothetical protein AMSG_07944 [Thecamonas trahens ATCC 50062]KNC51852.1 hypothetical protein AMSG_07944 [Thecamonas trahens ATCC 50062]|eukprot:XP_013755713.1 hypothetical protein AMSG_07944 [Thecamonas trahens ATCC 50062]
MDAEELLVELEFDITAGSGRPSRTPSGRWPARTPAGLSYDRRIVEGETAVQTQPNGSYHDHSELDSLLERSLHRVNVDGEAAVREESAARLSLLEAYVEAEELADASPVRLRTLARKQEQHFDRMAVGLRSRKPARDSDLLDDSSDADPAAFWRPQPRRAHVSFSAATTPARCPAPRGLAASMGSRPPSASRRPVPLIFSPSTSPIRKVASPPPAARPAPRAAALVATRNSPASTRRDAASSEPLRLSALDSDAAAAS